MSEAMDATPTPPLPEPPAGDANDYSRFNDLNMDSDSDDNADADALPSVPPSHTVAESISLAAASKDTGNASFKDGQYVEAKLHYDTAVKLLTPHKDLKPPAVSEQEATELRSLLASLHGNSAMVLMKQEDWATATKCANHMLGLEPDNVKGLFRRGSCQRKIGNMEAAKADMQRILELDPNNAPAKKELAEILKLLKQQKEKERAAFAGAFSNGTSMYADREQERVIKAKKLEDERRKEQDEWTQSKLSRREQGLSEQTFEEWKKERDEKRKEAEKAAKVKAAPPAKPKSSTGSGPKKPKVENSEPDAEYDEEDAKLIKEATSKGYCYFRNQLDTETKELIGDIRPKVLSSGEPAVEATSVPAPAATVAASDWNHAGTWEERDFSQMVKTRLSETCLQASYERADGAARSSVTEVKKCEGEAQVVLTRGKKRHLFDYQMDLKFETKHGNSKYTGHLNFTDVSPGCNFECSISYKKSIPKEAEADVKNSVAGLRDTIVSKIKEFEMEYKSM